MQHSIQRLFASAALLAASFLSASNASAAGLVQVSLSGNMDQDGGMRVEFAVEAGGRATEFHGHLARDTRPGDLAALIEHKLKRSGIEYIKGPDSAPRGPFHFFIEDCEMIRLRIGGGLEARLTAVDEAPTALRFLKPRTTQENSAGDLRIFLSTETVADHKESVVALELELPETRASATWVAEHLATAASARGLKSRRPQSDAWSSSGTTSGAITVGMSIELYSSADWAVEMRLAPLVGNR